MNTQQLIITKNKSFEKTKTKTNQTKSRNQKLIKPKNKIRHFIIRGSYLKLEKYKNDLFVFKSFYFTFEKILNKDFRKASSKKFFVFKWLAGMLVENLKRDLTKS